MVLSIKLLRYNVLSVEIVKDLIKELFIYLQYPKGAVLVFMPGLAEITSLYERLQNNHVVGNRNKHRFVNFIHIFNE